MEKEFTQLRLLYQNQYTTRRSRAERINRPYLGCPSSIQSHFAAVRSASRRYQRLVTGIRHQPDSVVFGLPQGDATVNRQHRYSLPTGSLDPVKSESCNAYSACVECTRCTTGTEILGHLVTPLTMLQVHTDVCPAALRTQSTSIGPSSPARLSFKTHHPHQELRLPPNNRSSFFIAAVAKVEST